MHHCVLVPAGAARLGVDAGREASAPARPTQPAFWNGIHAVKLLQDWSRYLEIAAIGSTQMLPIFVSSPKLASLEETRQSVLQSVRSFCKNKKLNLTSGNEPETCFRIEGVLLGCMIYLQAKSIQKRNSALDQCPEQSLNSALKINNVQL